ncbi:MAG: DUF3137 domain-containing protein [Parvibaculum sp.]|uniref:DUF3137 domain-containing protein n=1 Tax=Parvibaculum sp. TaxID=2024848 RepID=UPI001D916945|nr:DUF3137 domain-containing protein [Parvibaculum sp.]MBX3489627.1 DUF3137 domain-containing protein [Parvibaculum sp.]MBX3494679.1 DUF3137 domain-containing protein [Parvibaculum sp.]MCW5726415.1 DUF3137 domain-containing protein [Parvibaculum sp.]
MPAADAPSGFDAFFAREIAPWIAEKEIERRAVFRRTLRRAVPIVGAGFVAFAVSAQAIEGEDMRGFALFVSVAIMVAGAATFGSVLMWGRKFAEELSAKIFDHFGYAYSPHVPADFLAAFESCHLLPSYSRKSLEDHVRGEVRGVPFELAEAFLERKVRRDKRDEYDLVFRGLVARFRFPKRFSSRTVLRADRGMLNALGHAGVAGERVRLEDPRFEKLFEVFSGDQVEARYLLTPAFMERMVALAELTGAPLQAAFEGGELLLAIDGRRGYFAQPSPWRDLGRGDHIRAFVDDIQLIGDIAATLKLDAQTAV